MKPLRFLFVANTTYSLWNFRRGLMEALRDAGIRLSVAARPDASKPALLQSGVDYIPLSVKRAWGNPWSELNLLSQLRRLLARENWDLVHTFTIKPNIYAPLSQLGFRDFPPIVTTFSGLGYLYKGKGPMTMMGRRAINWLHPRLVEPKLKAMLFENEEDCGYFREHRLISDQLPVLVNFGSGIDTSEFTPDKIDPEVRDRLRRERNISDQTVVVAFIGRILKDKGVLEFVEAARRVISRHPGLDVRFAIIGRLDAENPSAISLESIKSWTDQGWIDYWGYVPDIHQALSMVDCVVLPSYREGKPTSLMEAAATGLPVVTTQAPGCKEVVEEGKTGFLVPPRDSIALAERILTLVQDRKLRLDMGRQGRVLAVRKFDQRPIIDRTIELYRQVLRSTGHAALLP